MIHFEIELINFVTKHLYLDSKWIQKKSNLREIKSLSKYHP
jgi:hypothetical protein